MRPVLLTIREHHRALLVAALALVFVWQWAITVGQPRDFGVYWTTGQRLLDGAPIYDPRDNPLLAYKYSPTFALLCAPLALLPLELARSLWFAANFALTLAVPLLAYELVAERTPARPGHRFAVCALATLLSLRYVTMNAAAGHVVALQLVLALGGLVLIERERTGGGAALLGLAILTKIVPVLLLGYLVLRRRWRAAGATVVAVGAWALLPALWLGISGDVALHLEWLRFIQAENTLDQLVRPQNQSLLALLTRLLVETPYGVHVAALPLDRVTALYGPILFGGFAVLVLALEAWVGRPGAELREDRLRVALVVILTYMTAIGPLSWRYGLLSMIVAWVFVADRALRGQRTPRVCVLAAVAVAFGVLTTRDVVGRPAETWSHLLGVEMWGGVLAAALSVALAGAPARPRAVAMPATAR
jgi:alpha-1,2-mannosyltransferase